MNKDYYKPYEGRDIKILDQHAANTIAEDQLLDHLAHVLMLKEQGIISQEDAAQILGAVLKLRREGPDIVPHKPGLTDLFSNVEEWVIDQVGIQVGGKMHTGRSLYPPFPAGAAHHAGALLHECLRELRAGYGAADARL